VSRPVDARLAVVVAAGLVAVAALAGCPLLNNCEDEPPGV